MTNLLPPAAKKNILVEYWVRVVCMWMVILALSLLIGSSVLWPTYVLLSGNNDAYAISASAATERDTEYRDISAVLEQSSTQAEQIVIISNEVKLTSVLDDIWAAVDSRQVTVTELALSRGDESLDTIRVVGMANDRQALAAFRDRLVDLPYVSEVVLPIDNLAKNEDLDFMLRLEITPETI